ncbi:MAG: PHP domain-containing protein [Acidimicrobiia bacterium]
MTDRTSPPVRRLLGGDLWRLAELTRATERRPFRAKAYRRAVWALDDLSPDLQDDDDEMLAVPGIGPGVVALIREFREQGRIKRLERLQEELPEETPALRRLPRVTAQVLRDLKSLGVESRSDLRIAIDSDLADAISGIGPATSALWDRILDLPPDDTAVPAFDGWGLATGLAHHIARHTGYWVDIGGDVRRMEEWVERIDLVVTGDSFTRVADFCTSTATLTTTTVGHAVVTGFAHSTLPVTVHWALPESSGTVLLGATGPEEHNSLLSDDAFATEEEAYRAAGLTLVPAPARHLPLSTGRAVMRMESIRGDLHIHSEASPDGHMRIDTICERAVALGYDYILISDHTLGLRFGGLGPTAVLAQAVEIESLRPRFPELSILHGAEVNIGADGSLDLDDETLAALDFVVAGLHSHFGLSEGEQTRRLLTALEHPAVGVLAHPFGRRIGIRPAIEVDMAAVINGSVRNRVALEVNGHRDRLDLPAQWLHTGVQLGAVFAASSDAHRVGELENISNAVSVLQRGGVGPDHVVNTWSETDLLAWRSWETPARKA